MVAKMSAINEETYKRPTPQPTSSTPSEARIFTINRALIAIAFYSIAGIVQHYLLNIWRGLYTMKPPRVTMVGTIPEIVPAPDGLALWIFFLLIFGTMDVLRQWVIKVADL